MTPGMIPGTTRGITGLPPAGECISVSVITGMIHTGTPGAGMAGAVILIPFHTTITAGMAATTTGIHISIHLFIITQPKNTPKDLLTVVLPQDPVPLPGAAVEDQVRRMEPAHPALLGSGEPVETSHPVPAPELPLTAEAGLSGQIWTESVRLFAPARMLMSEE